MDKKQLPGSISFFGASSVYGISDPLGGFVGRFRNWYDHHRENGVVYNMGIPAETTDELVKRFKDEHKRRNSHLIIFKVGTNDAHRDGGDKKENYVPKKRFLNNIQILIEAALESAHVAFISPYPVNDAANPHGNGAYYFSADIEDYTYALKEFTKEKYNLVFIDIFSDWIKQEDYVNKYLSSDGLHANGDGYQYIADRVQEAILQNFSHF